MGSHNLPPASTIIMATLLKSFLLFLLLFTAVATRREVQSACGLKMQVLSSSTSMTTMLRCEDTLSRRNPRWNVTDVSGQTLGQLRLQGVGFSAVSIPWRNVRGLKVNVECTTSSSCVLAASLTRRGELQSQDLTSPTSSPTSSPLSDHLLP